MSDIRKLEISIPCDNEGFVLLKCPLCGELFKLKPSDFREDSIFEIHCPSCGLVSDNYFTEDVIELVEIMARNYANEMIMNEFKKVNKGSLLQFKGKNKNKKETPIMLTINALEKVKYSCCKMEAKIKPLLKMCGSYCAYCGVKDYGNK